jgi:hypothetical protein
LFSHEPRRVCKKKLRKVKVSENKRKTFVLGAVGVTSLRLKAILEYTMMFPRQCFGDYLAVNILFDSSLCICGKHKEK